MRAYPWFLALLPASTLFLLGSPGCVESSKVGTADPNAAIEGEVGAVGEALDADDPGEALAKQVEALLVGPQGKCKNCHSITRQTVRDWAEAMQAIDTACFRAPGLTPVQRVDCLRVDPGSSASPFSAHKLGLYATAARSPQFAQLFHDAYGVEQGRSLHLAFAKKVGMPLNGTPLPADDVAAIKSWVLRGTPAIEGVFEDGITPNPNCDETVASGELLAHVEHMKTEGWGARLADLATPMFGCGASANPLDCLATQADVTAAYGEPAAAQKVRQLYALPFESHYWVRSSADGRHVGFGLFNGARVVNLAQPAKPIKVGASYDPYFFPGNDGFSFAGVAPSGDMRACRQSLLADVAGAANPTISMHEAKCSKVSGSVYQSVGASLDGVRYFVTIGSHENDDGGHEITAPLPTQFGQSASTRFIPMENNGQSYQVGSSIIVGMPGEGDAILSPSNLLVSTRFRRPNGQSAYRVRLVKAEGAGAGLTLDTPVVAQVCVPGSKASFSFDERFLVTHQYVDHADPDQASLPEGSSNVVVVDLTTGKKTRITKMGANQFALFPHFRADGWLYYLVRDMAAGKEFLVASDFAIRAAQ
jgi:hypothetical protein